MKQDDLAVLNGKVDALSVVLTQLIGTAITPVQAAQAALAVKIERESWRDAADYATPEAEIAATERVLESYAQLLLAVASRG